MTDQMDPQAKKQRRLKRIAAFLALILILLLAALAYYLLTRKSLTNVIPGAPDVAPRYVTSVYRDFGTISGVAVSPDGTNVYVVDQPNSKVWRFNANGTLLGTFGGPKDKTARNALKDPMFVACAPNGDVYVTDRTQARITIFSRTGTFKQDFRPVVKNFTWSPIGVWVDNNSNVYVADANGDVEHRILVFDKIGKLKFKVGKAGRNRGELSFPNGVSVDGNGNIFVADSNNARVQEFDNKGKFVRILPGDFSRPIGIDASFDGRVEVVDMFAHNVTVFNGTTGARMYTYGGQGIQNGEFRYPMGIAISQNGRVYIADRQNRRLQIWQY